jgi:hypothetical protein
MVATPHNHQCHPAHKVHASSPPLVNEVVAVTNAKDEIEYYYWLLRPAVIFNSYNREAQTLTGVSLDECSKHKQQNFVMIWSC